MGYSIVSDGSADFDAESGKVSLGSSKQSGTQLCSP